MCISVAYFTNIVHLCCYIFWWYFLHLATCCKLCISAANMKIWHILLICAADQFNCAYTMCKTHRYHLHLAVVANFTICAATSLKFLLLVAIFAPLLPPFLVLHLLIVAPFSLLFATCPSTLPSVTTRYALICNCTVHLCCCIPYFLVLLLNLMKCVSLSHSI